MKNDLISIVIPCYNVEKYVEKCIKSIINQSYQNIEIIIVNDGSTDSTLSVIEKIKKTDNRIFVYSKPNGGLSDARNFGLKKSKGKYICFVDSDDYVDTNYIKKLYYNIVENGSDISCCDFWYVDEVGKKWSNKNKTNKTYNSIEAMKDFFSGNQDLEVMTWNKMYKIELFLNNNIIFPIGKLHEDNFTTYKLFYYAKKISLIDNKLYYYLQRENSIMGKKFNSRRLDKIEALEEAKKFIKQKNIDLKYELIRYEFSTYLYLMNNMIKSKYDKKQIKMMRKKILANYSTYLKNNSLTLFEKICLFNIKNCFFIYKILYQIIIGRNL